MPMTERQVNTLIKKGLPGKWLAASPGLYICVTSSTAAHWERLYLPPGTRRQRVAGMGSAKAFSLAEAIKRNSAFTRKLADGKDPLAEKWERNVALCGRTLRRGRLARDEIDGTGA